MSDILYIFLIKCSDKCNLSTSFKIRNLSFIFKHPLSSVNLSFYCILAMQLQSLWYPISIVYLFFFWTSLDNIFNKILKVSHCKYDYLCQYQISAASPILCPWLLIITISKNLFNFQFKTSSVINVHTNTAILLTINTAEPGVVYLHSTWNLPISYHSPTHFSTVKFPGKRKLPEQETYTGKIWLQH